MVTEAIYDQGLAINGDLIPVARDGLWGYVNAAGEEIISCQYLAPLLIDPDHDRWAAYPRITDESSRRIKVDCMVCWQRMVQF